MSEPRGVQIVDDMVNKRGLPVERVPEFVDMSKLLLIRKGASPREANAYFGQPGPMDLTPDVDRALAAASRKRFEEHMAAPTEEATNIIDDFIAGFTATGTGLFVNQRMPKVFTPEEASFFRHTVNMLGAVASDIPLFWAGAAIGGAGGAPTGPGAAVTAFGASFALPMAWRQVLTDRYTKGEVASFSEFWPRLAAAVIQASKGYVAGASVGTANVVAARAGASAVTQLMLEITALTKVGAALEGEVPEPQDYALNIIAVGGLRLGHKAAQNVGRKAASEKIAQELLRDHIGKKVAAIYVRTGKHPNEVVRDMREDPSIVEDILSENRVVPRAYEEIDVSGESPIVPIGGRLGPERIAIERTAELEPADRPRAAEGAVDVGGPMSASEMADVTRLERFRLGNKNVEADARGEGSGFEYTGEIGDSVTIYRAVPTGTERIRPGEYASLSREYAEGHLADHLTGRHIENPELARGGRVIEITVPRDDVVVLANNEVAWSPRTPTPRAAEGAVELPKVSVGDLSRVGPRGAQGAMEMDVTSGKTRVVLDRETIARMSRDERAELVRHEMAHKVETDAELWRDTDTYLWDLWETNRNHPIFDYMGEVTGRNQFTNSQSPEIVAHLYSKEYPTGKFKAEIFTGPLAKEGVPVQEFAIPPELMRVLDAIESKLGIWGKRQSRAAGPPAPPGEPPRPPGEPPSGGEPPGPPRDVPPEIMDAITEARESIAAHIQWGDVPKEARDWSWQRFYQHAVDKHDPMRRAIKDATGTDPEFSENAFKQITNLAGVSGRARNWIEHQPFKYGTLENVGKGLETILEPLNRLDPSGPIPIENFSMYLAAKRAIELDRRGIETGFDISKARIWVSANEKRFVPLQRDFVEFNQHILTYLVDSGIVSKKAKSLMVPLNNDYVPFQRVFEALDRTRAGKKPSPNSAKLFRIEGSEREIFEPIGSTVANLYRQLEAADRNAALRLFVDTMAQAGRTEYAVKKERPIVPSKVNPAARRRIVDKLEQEGKLTPEEAIDLEQMLDETMIAFRPDKQPLGENEVMIFRDGKPEIWELAPNIADGVLSVGPAARGLAIELLRGPTRTLRAGAILTPEFMARNPGRDIPIAWIQSESGFKFFSDTLYGAFAATAGTRTGGKFLGALAPKATAKARSLYSEWLKGGGAQAEWVALDRKYLQQNIRMIANQTGLLERARNVVTHPLEVLRIGSQLSEQMTRVGVQRRAMLEGKGAGEAAFETRGSTIDFARMGLRMEGWNQIAAFSNARVQGWDRVATTIKEHPGRTFRRVAIGVTLPAILFRVANRLQELEDREKEKAARERGEKLQIVKYSDLPLWQRELFYPISIDSEQPDGTTSRRWIRFPKPHEYGLLFGTMAEKAVEHIFYNDPDAFDDLVSRFGAGGAQLITPTALIPVIETLWNRSILTGAPVLNAVNERMLPEFQYGANTTELSKWLGKMLSELPFGLSDTELPIVGEFRRSKLASPKIIENFVRGWSGGLGTQIMHGLDDALRYAGKLPPGQIRTRRLEDMPVIRAFMIRQPNASLQPIADFFDRYGKLRQNIETFNELKDRGNLEDAMRVARLGIFNPKATVTALKRQRKFLRRVERMPDRFMPPEARNRFMDEVFLQMLQIATEGNRQLDAFEEFEEKRAAAERARIGALGIPGVGDPSPIVPRKNRPPSSTLSLPQ